MQRLTFKDGRRRNTILINGQEHHGPIADRLAAYEATGLEPETVLDVAEKAIQFEMDLDEERSELARYRDLDVQGLLVELPCKEGDTVYTVGPDQPVIDTWKVFHIGATLEMPCFGKLCRFDDFGKTVFLTREEAEAACEALKERRTR